MTVTTRDPWSDAYQAATQKVLEGDLVGVRRRIWLRRVLGLVLGGVVSLGVLWSMDFVIDPDADDLWHLQLPALHASFGLLGLGLVLMVIGAIRTSGAARPFIGSDAFLSRADRSWLRTQVAEGQLVPEERRAVVTDTARGMVVEGRYLLTYLGLTVMYLGTILGGPSLGTLITFSVLIVWMLVRVVRGAIWSRRARRWLARCA